jgi:hypothetical protein
MHAAFSPFRRAATPGDHRSAGDLCHDVPTIDAADANARVMEIFSAHRDLSSLAVVEDGRPIGLINRNIFLSQISKPFPASSTTGRAALPSWTRNRSWSTPA